MSRLEDLLAQMEHNPAGVRFSDLSQVCDHFFGKPRQGGTSHRVYNTPWRGDPRVNIHSKKGKARSYQVRQVLKAIERLRVEHGIEK